MFYRSSIHYQQKLKEPQCPPTEDGNGNPPIQQNTTWQWTGTSCWNLQKSGWNSKWLCRVKGTSLTTLQTVWSHLYDFPRRQSHSNKVMTVHSGAGRRATAQEQLQGACLGNGAAPRTDGDTRSCTCSGQGSLVAQQSGCQAFTATAQVQSLFGELRSRKPHCMCIHMNACVCVCVCVYIYIHEHTHTHTYRRLPWRLSR